MNLKKPINLFIYFLIFLGICVFLFKDTEAFKNINLFSTTTTKKPIKKTKITKSACAKFIEEAENGKYNDYNKCYGDCVYLNPAKDASLYCGMGSECDAFCYDNAY